MAQLHEADAPVSARSYEPVRSYGWSAEEVVRHEQVKRNTPHPAAAREAAPAPGAPRTPQARTAQPRTPQPRTPQPRTAQPQAPAADAQDVDERAIYYDGDTEGAERRAGMVRSRRRMLWLLVALTVVGIALVFGQLASWWILLPPAALLAGYLLLLREAAQADSEAREHREAARAAADRLPPAQPAEPATGTSAGPASVATPYETGPRADVIDLSEHVGDQLYDQYVDAKLRAVGD